MLKGFLYFVGVIASLITILQFITGNALGTMTSWGEFLIEQIEIKQNTIPEITSKPDNDIIIIQVFDSEPKWNELVEVWDTKDGEIIITSDMISSNVNINIVGSYTVTYNIYDTFNENVIYVLNVNVEDSIKPEITLNPNTNTTILQGDPFIFENYSVTDNYDSELQGTVDVGNFNTNVPGTYSILISTVDESGNTKELQYYLIVTKEVIKIYSDEDFLMALNEPSRNYILENDITYQHSDIYMDNIVFDGVLDGNGNTITILPFESNSSLFVRVDEGVVTTYGGLFSINNGVIKNIKFSHLNIQSVSPSTDSILNHSGSYKIVVGGIVGINNGVIENVSIANSSFVIDRNNSIFGGIAGINNGTISDSEITSDFLDLSDELLKTVIYSTGDVGGIAGWNQNGGSISNSVFIGEIGLFVANDDGGETIRSWGGIVANNIKGTVDTNYVDVRFSYYGENNIYHNTILGIHNKCNLQIKMGTIIGHQHSEGNSFLNNHSGDSNYLNVIDGFHTGSHEKEYLFANDDGKIGKLDE